MAIQGGFGVVCKINTGSLTAIAGIMEIDFPEQRKVLAEATAHDSPDGYREYLATGLRELSDFSMTLAWDDSETTHAAIVTAFDSDSPVSMSIEDPNGAEVIAFSAHIEVIGRIGKLEEVYQAEVKVQPTGGPTIT